MLSSPAGLGGPPQRGGLWPLAPPTQPPSTFAADGFGRYGVYSLFPGGPGLGGALFSHASAIGRFTGSLPPSSGSPFHTTHKESLFSTAGYTFGAPTPPPGSPYSPTLHPQLELLAKGFSPNLIQTSPCDFSAKSSNNNNSKRCCDEKATWKLEKGCSCQGSPVRVKVQQEGCSRTNPIEWGGQVHVKKEPCQVAEVTTSASPIVKIEVASPTHHKDTGVVFNGNIPVGIAVARQRVHSAQTDMVSSPSLPPAGLLTTVNTTTQIKEVSRIADIDALSAAGMATGGVPGGGTLLSCTDDRVSSLGGWSMGGVGPTPPTLWQYPATLPMEPMVPLHGTLPMPVPPVGVQLVREPTSGHFLILPTAGIEQLQQALVWPSYTQPPSVLLPPPPPLQLLSSASSDYLASSTTLHQHTQTHSTRLLAVTTTDHKRKLPMPIPTTTFIKIETDATGLDQSKTLQACSTIASSTGTVFTDPSMTPLVTTHVIYQHPTANLFLSHNPQTESSTICRTQATSPVTCLTPPPETSIVPVMEEEPMHVTPGVQDASNQTDAMVLIEEEPSTTEITQEEKEHEVHMPTPISTPQPEEHQELEVPEQPKQLEEPPCEVPVLEQNDVQLPQPDLSGLELLSNSIVEFESKKEELQPSQPPQQEVDKLGGLSLLCALAEQRFMEELEETQGEPRRDTKPAKLKRRHADSEERKKRKSKHKKARYDDLERRKVDGESRKMAVLERVTHEKDTTFSEMFQCKDGDHRTYKSRESEQEARKYLASKSLPPFVKDTSPEMNALELDMRLKLADLQRKYREKQRELSKLKPKRKSSEEKETKRRKSRKRSDRSTTPPPLLDKMDEVDLKQQKTVNQEHLKPPTLCVETVKTPAKEAHSVFCADSHQRQYSPVLDLSDSTPEKTSSSKKRKVGRPKKIMSSSPFRTGTETIVAKKPKTGSFVCYLMAAKQKLQMQNKNETAEVSSPPRYLEQTTRKRAKNHNNNHIMANMNKRTTVERSKIRPKLKAEATVRTSPEEDELNPDNDDGWDVHDEPAKCETSEPILIVDATPEVQTANNNRCVLTAAHLDTDRLRVLTVMGGLFYAGCLHPVQPPDVYSITLDGERGNRPHIMSREEILRDAIVEVFPSSTAELVPGTRLCAYWSQQYRCLYPGSVAEPGTPDPELDQRFVSVEFDDGDSGRIALEDIRLLPPAYPIMEYDPNPLLSLCKRRRRTSVTSLPPELSQSLLSPALASPEPCHEHEKENKDMNKPDERSELQKEKKRAKKRKRDKLKQKLEKRKKKHRCSEDKCKHKKHHRKHRKHKRHHQRNAQVEPEVAKADVEETKNMDAPAEMEVCDEAVVAMEEPEKMEEMASVEVLPELANPDDEVTMDDILESKQSKRSKKIRDRQESCESRSKMTAFLPARQMWSWAGKGYRRPKAKGRSRKQFYREIQRRKETIMVGDSAVFLSTGRPDRPYIGKIEAMWETCGTMVVRVKWFYHPEETVGCPLNLKYPGALFESPHVDENDVQTISHKCEVLPLAEYRTKLGDDPQRYATIYDNNDIYYLAGYYDPSLTALRIEPDIPFTPD